MFAAHDPAHAGLVPTDAIRWSSSIALEIVRLPRVFLFAAQNRLLRRVLEKVEAAFNPGFILHVAARKALIDKLGRQAIESGCSQVIVLGAGYDTFGLRAATSYSDVTCFEIDHPSTQELKRAAIAPGEVPSRLFFVPADLSMRPVGEVLAAHPRFDPRLQTLIVIEGVLMYLPAEAVTRLFAELTSRFRDGLTCIFTFMDRRADGDIQFRTAHPLINWWLRQKHEQFLWGMERDRLPAYLAEFGFVTTATYGREELTKACFDQSAHVPRLAEGELVGVARS